ncbi:MAG: OmpA family protein [Aquificaceae bacterium]|nr:OmpA family protein [Aquificaceae bacterium]MDW8097823.1 OmpA family protein [Aquificaceae bacterium]
MKKTAVALVASSLVIAQDFTNTKLMDGINQLQRGMELAKKKEADLRNPYHFEKAKTQREVSYILASHLDEVGAWMFMVKSFNALSKAVSEKPVMDQLAPQPENSKSHAEKLGIAVESLVKGLIYVRENRGFNCAPAELARGEAYYEALVYELSKSRPNADFLVDFYKRSWAEINKATEMVDLAREGQLECYTGVPFVVQVQRREPEKPPVPLEPAPHQASPREEPLMVTARIHFDFNKHTIKREYIPLLNEVVKTLQENPNIRVRIEGFTDHVGTKAYNERLALRRAQAVRDYLIRAGIPADRIEVAGFGKDRYIADNKTPMGRFTNRRAEFIILQVPGR